MEKHFEIELSGQELSEHRACITFAANHFNKFVRECGIPDWQRVGLEKALESFISESLKPKTKDKK